MKIAILRERRPHEARVAATPETVKRFVAYGASVAVESGAGLAAAFRDEDYAAAGAQVAPTPAAALEGAEIVLKVQRPLLSGEGEDELALIPTGALLIGLLDPHRERDSLDAYARRPLTAFSMELLPRISRAQTMDVLSSQANLAGYKAVLDATAEFPRAVPLMMTAAGRINAARVFVMGAGVAGLQAIATARRLGAIVSATDVRPAAREQVMSLGASFVMVESEETKAAETSGGYAKEMSADYQRRQAELVAAHIKTQDIVITTALIPGRAAPRLVTEEMVKSMRPGSVIVDLVVEYGGNCALSVAGEVKRVGGVAIVGHRNVPGRVPTDASALYARNLLNFVEVLLAKDKKSLAIDWSDEIIKGTCLTRDGAIVHPSFPAGGKK
ncbi:MAG: Re/Si-specific NAD(P)(+) transhydrogenase subunit alpha [Alphaproteobacteria bacterium]|nr:Re/Si-specific NAD(P)(+) transhydrogenase subunit alpha [Alphaproteobacteria bacterium]